MNSNTQRQERTEKACTKCGLVKPMDEFHNSKAFPDGKAYSCKPCVKAQTDARRKTPEYKEKVKQWSKAYLSRRVQAGEHKIMRRVQRHMAKGMSKEEAVTAALAGPQQRMKSDDERQRVLAEKNALQAWRYWFTEKASQEWLDGYYARQPWKDHRISQAESFRLQYKHDPEFCLQQRMRAHMRRQKKKDKIGDVMRMALKANGKSNTVERLLGYTIADLRLHLERQFTKGMTWKRFADGDIHIDHIIPISSFNFENVGDPEWKACWALSNLRPLWAKDNLAKSAKIVSLL